MIRTTVFLDGSLLRRARAFARREGKSFAAVVREAIATYVSGGERPRPRLPSVAGQFASGRADVSERAEELLWREPHG